MAGVSMRRICLRFPTCQIRDVSFHASALSATNAPGKVIIAEHIFCSCGKWSQREIAEPDQPCYAVPRFQRNWIPLSFALSTSQTARCCLWRLSKEAFCAIPRWQNASESESPLPRLTGEHRTCTALRYGMDNRHQFPAGARIRFYFFFSLYWTRMEEGQLPDMDSNCEYYE
jgi:hypothetical protein